MTFFLINHINNFLLYFCLFKAYVFASKKKYTEDDDIEIFTKNIRLIPQNENIIWFVDKPRYNKDINNEQPVTFIKHNRLF